MLAGYYDKSGGDDQPATVVAGYVSTVFDWIDFDKAWKAFLARPEYDVPYFHMKAFAHSKKPFDNGWEGQHTKRREFLEGLIAIIASHAFRGFAVAVETRVFADFVAKPGVAALYPSAYAYCGRQVVGRARVWAEAQRFRLPMQSWFEYGDQGWGELERILVRDGHPVPARKPKLPTTQADIDDCLTPLQAADFAAYELLKAHRLLDAKEDLVWEDFRESFKALERSVISEWGVSTAENLTDFLARLKAAKSLEDQRLYDRPPSE